MSTVLDQPAIPSSPAAEFRLDRLAELVRATRSGQVELLHIGALAVVDSAGTLLGAVGDPEVPVYWRSVAKPHQAVALIAEGGVERLGLEDEHLTVISASHHGLPEQIQRVEQVLARAGHGPAALRCGVHAPVSQRVLEDFARTGRQPTPLYNMCSGNHAGLLCLSRLLGVEGRDYDQLAHPVQQRLLEVMGAYAGVEGHTLETGIDGCGIPTYRTSLSRLALAYARLAHPSAGIGPREVEASIRLFRAVNTAPALLSAEGELDVEFIRALGGTGLCKLGAGGMLAACVRPSERWPSGVGIALKLADGLSERARGVALMAVLDQLEIGSPEQRRRLRARVPHDLLNNRGEPVGTLVPAFQLAPVPRR